MVLANSTNGIYTALSRAAPMPASCIWRVRSRKAATVCSSVPRVLVVLAPVMPSLKEPVMREFSFRTFRFQRRMRFWKYPVSTAMTGTMTMTTRASRQFRASMAAKVPST